MRGLHILLALLCSLSLVSIAAAPAAGKAGRAPAGDPPFPRLAMWHPSYDRNTIPECAAYDTVVGNFQDPLPGNATKTFADALRAANPKIELLTYFTNSVIRHSALYGGTRKTNPFIKDWPARWFLTEPGTTLPQAVDARSEVIPLAQWEQRGPNKRGENVKWVIFRRDYDVLCDGEIMVVTGLDPTAKTITVKRGMNGTRAKAHPAGARVAPILRFWAGSYIMNLTEDCPKAKLHGAPSDENWAEYSFRMSKRGSAPWFWFTGGDQDGFLFDLMADTITWTLFADTRGIDIDQDNKADALADLDTKWLTGIKDVTAMFEKTFPGAIIIRNNSRCRRFADYNGENFIGFPDTQWAKWDIDGGRGMTKYWHRFFFGNDREEVGGIQEYVNNSHPPVRTIVETTDIETDLDFAGHPEILDPERWMLYKPDYQKMRWGLTSALVAGAYYCWVIHTDGHGQLGLFWFDEYDAGGKQRGYLGGPVADMYQLVADKPGSAWGCWGREFDGGFVICNPLDREVTAELPPGTWQRIEGHQVPEVNSGVFEEGQVKVPAYDGLILLRAKGGAGKS